MHSDRPFKPKNIDACVDHILEAIGQKLVVATPLGIGKPNHLLNALWGRAKKDASLSLEIFTALSLEVPRGKALLERRFLQEFNARQFADYPELEYIADIKRGDVPANMRVSEFYMQSGKYLSSPLAQRWYTSSNYTHVSRDVANRGVNVLAVMVGCRDDQSGAGKRYSLGSNPDLTIDLARRMQRRQQRAQAAGRQLPFFVVAVVNRHMPFMTGEAEVGETFFDAILDQAAYEHPIFAVPRQPINSVDYLIGLHASALVDDGGTLQVGIGSLGDALVYATELRHRDSTQYRSVLKNAGMQRFEKVIEENAAAIDALGEFKQGLYAASEMFTEGFMHLYKAGVLKRCVYPDLTIQNLLNQGKIIEQVSLSMLEALRNARAITSRLDQVEIDWLVDTGVFRAGTALDNDALLSSDGVRIDNNLDDENNWPAIEQHLLGDTLNNAAILHAAFFLGSKDFYQWLHSLSDEQRELFQMTGVSQINELYNAEARDRAQRLKARFINTTIKVSLTGAASSDGLEDNQVVSGVGGQYNFVAMAHALQGSRSIIMLRAVRDSAHGAVSNIVWQYPYDTIPRHLRDIVISEYGIADLRSKNDEDCIKAMLCIADSRFQAELMATAKQHNKLDPNWDIPAEFCSNLPERIEQLLKSHRDNGLFPAFPYGCDFSDDELQLVKALGWLKARTGSRAARLKLLLQSLGERPGEREQPLLALMNLQSCKSLEEKLNRQLLLRALKLGSE